MIEVKHLLRRSYIEALSVLEYSNISIPVNENFLDTRVGPAILPGNVEAYVIIQNQTVNDASAKCGVNQDTSLQLDVITIFPPNSGGSLICELISTEILSILFPESRNVISLPEQVGIKIWRGWLEGSREIVQESDTNRIFRNILIFNHSITQI